MFTLITAALAGTPIQVTYNVRFDVDETGDRICSFTKLCDCTSTYSGTGELVSSADGRQTFRGSWAQTANTCGDPLVIWTPADGVAFHTLGWKGDKLTEWVVHRDAQKHERLTSDMKANGQFWMNELNHVWPATTIEVQQTDGSSIGGAIQLTAAHSLSIELGGKAKTSSE